MNNLSDLPPLDNGGPPFGVTEVGMRWSITVPVFWEQIKLSFKHGGFVTFTAANPVMLQEGKRVHSKTAHLDMISGAARRFLPPYFSIRRDDRPFPKEAIAAQMAHEGFDFPIVAKPDLGSEGYGVWLIKDWERLEQYWEAYPVDADILLQRKIPHEPEAGVFYIRDPETDEAHIFSLSLKYSPTVTGDGTSTIRKLIEADARVAGQAKKIFKKPNIDFDRVPVAGERVALSFVGNREGGGIYRDGKAFITPKLLAAFDEISRSMGEYYFGRFDIRFESLAKLKEGEGFELIEVNGAMSVPGDIFDNRCTLAGAADILKRMFRHAYRIGGYHRRRGLKVPGLIQQYREHFAFMDLAKQYPPSE